MRISDKPFYVAFGRKKFLRDIPRRGLATSDNPALCQLPNSPADLLNRIFNYTVSFNTELEVNGNVFVVGPRKHIHSLFLG